MNLIRIKKYLNKIFRFSSKELFRFSSKELKNPLKYFYDRNPTFLKPYQVEMEKEYTQENERTVIRYINKIKKNFQALC